MPLPKLTPIRRQQLADVYVRAAGRCEASGRDDCVNEGRYATLSLPYDGDRMDGLDVVDVAHEFMCRYFPHGVPEGAPCKGAGATAALFMAQIVLTENWIK